MAWSTNKPDDPFAQRQRDLAEEEKRLAEEAARLHARLAAEAEEKESRTRAARLREENPALHPEAEPVPVHRHSAMRRRDRARFFVLLFVLLLVVLWLVRVLG